MTDATTLVARGTDTAVVVKAGERAGTLRRIDGGVEFRYDDTYVANRGRPVAPTLPIDAGPRVTAGGAVPPVFAGLLPEGRRLAALRQHVKTSADDELTLLVAVGADPIGDIAVLPDGAPPVEPEPLVSVDRSFAEVRFADVLADAGVIDSTAIPGVQDKGSAKGLSLPIGSAGDRYILKVDPPEHPQIVANEAYFLTLAAVAGLPVAEHHVVHDADGRPGLLVRRFDRVPRSDGEADRLECFDACQLLDRWPADKYRVTAADVIAAVADQCGAPPVAVRDAYRQFVFAWLTGNGDLHAKNISVLRGQDGETRVAPAYDLPSTVPSGDTTMALTIDRRTDGLSKRRWLEFAEQIGLQQRAAQRAIGDLLDATSHLASDIADGVLPFDETRTHDLVRQLRARRRLLTGD